jgi:hypothetical protein
MGNVMLQRLFLIGLAVALCSGAAGARECRGIAFPDQVQLDGRALSLNGLGLRKATIFKVKVYVAALYLPQPSNSADAILSSNPPAQLILHFVRDVGAGDIRKAWDEGFAKSAAGRLPDLKDRIASLDAWMQDVKTGQRLTFTFKPGDGVEVNLNGVAKGAIKGDDFARALLSIWLGDEPPNPDIKTGLLGGACE